MSTTEIRKVPEESETDLVTDDKASLIGNDNNKL